MQEPNQICFVSEYLRESEKDRVRNKVCSPFEGSYIYKENSYCILHLPLDSEDKNKNEFDIAYDTKKDNNDFNFQWVCFPDDLWIADKTIETEIDCSNAVFRTSIYLIRLNIRKKVSFHNAVIYGHLEIKDSTFEDEADFQHCTINQQFSLDKTHFNKSANFSVLRVCGFAYLSDNYFHGDANFDLSRFCRDADFDDCEFNEAKFRYTKFFSEATFDNSEFLAEARFDNAEFGKFAGFRKTKFRHICVFDHVLFFHEVFFYRALFDDIAYFEHTNFAIDNDAEDWNHGGYFHECRFKSFAFFNNSKFKLANFFSSEFKKTANFAEIEVRRDACFEASVFEGVVVFRYAKFFQRVSFCYSDFYDLVSFRGNNDNKIFYGTLDLQEVKSAAAERIQFQTVRLFPNWFVNIDSTKLSFIDIHWKNADGTRKKIEIELKVLQKRLVKENIYRLLTIACRQLATNAEEHNRFEEASNFRRMAFEIEWLEKSTEKNKWLDKIVRSSEIIKRRFVRKKVDLLAPLKRTLYILRNFDFVHPIYRITSFYGESWKRAAIVLAIIIFLIFPFIYTQTEFQISPKNIPLEVAIKDCQYVIEELKTSCRIENRQLFFWEEAIPHSLATASLQSVESRVPKTIWGSIWMILEKIFAPLQAALLALALRRKFMR